MTDTTATLIHIVIAEERDTSRPVMYVGPFSDDTEAELYAEHLSTAGWPGLYSATASRVILPANAVDAYVAANLAGPENWPVETAQDDTYPDADTVHVMLYWDWFDVSDPEGDEIEVDTEAMTAASDAIDLRAAQMFPNATVFISHDRSDYAQFHSRVSIWSDQTGARTAEADEALHEMIREEVNSAGGFL